MRYGINCFGRRIPLASNRAWRRFIRTHPTWHAPHGCTLAKGAGIAGAIGGIGLGVGVALAPVVPAGNGAAPTGVAPVVVSDGASAVGATLLAWLPTWFAADGASMVISTQSVTVPSSDPAHVLEPSALAVFAVGAGATIMIGRRKSKSRA